MTLQNIIRTIPNWTTKTATELRSDLLASVVGSDSQLYTYAGIILKLGDTAGLGLRATLRTLAQPGNPSQLPTELYEALDFAHARLEGPGLDFSLDSVQATIDALTMIPQLSAMVPALKAIGRPTRTYYSSQGGSGDVPSEAVIALERDKASKEDAAIDRLQAYREALPGWDGDPETEPVL